MKNVNDQSGSVEDPAGRFKRECAEVTTRFASYPAEYLEWIGMEAWEVAKDALKKKRVNRRVISMIDSAMIMLVAAAQVRGKGLEDLQGLSVAESLPVLTGDMIAEGWSL
jgi:hypothetical protein